MKRVLDWAGAGLVAIVGMGLGLTSLFLIRPYFHSSEPAFAEGLVPNNQAIIIDRDVDDRLTAALKQKFPPGTKESWLKMILYLQGFRSVPPISLNCDPGDYLLPYDKSAICDEHVDATLKYIWYTDVKCRHGISVRWATNGQAQVEALSGYYRGGGCLRVGR